MDEDDFDKLMQNAMLYGMGVLVVRMDDRLGILTRVIPREEYAQTAEHLRFVDQNTKDFS
jgi:hypothetical protein